MFGTYYLVAPAGYFALDGCPNRDAAEDFGNHLFGVDAASSWDLCDDAPDGAVCLELFRWGEEAPDAWLETPGWRQLLEFLCDGQPYSDPSLRADLTRDKGLVRGAVCRIAAEELRAAEVRIRNAAGPFGAEDLAAMRDNPAEFLNGLAKAIEGPR